MPYCSDCSRSFVNKIALKQHLNSSIHGFKCVQCRREFVSQHALDQHLNSSIHSYRYIQPVFECNYCDRRFANRKALDQHLNSSVHTPVYSCYECDRDFVNQGALNQHLNSSIHAVTQFHCCECDRDFNNEASLEQHLRDKVHRPKKTARAEFFCNTCDRVFGNGEALRRHLASVIHHPLIENVKCISGGSCSRRFTSPSAMLHHLESGACSSGITKRRIDQVISERDTGNIITSGNSLGRIENGWSPSASSSSMTLYTPQGAFTPRTSTLSTSGDVLGLFGGGRSCLICNRTFKTVQAARAHIYSSVHSPKIYHCPLPLVPDHIRGNGKMANFSTLSGLAQHLESGACKGGKSTFRKAMRLVNGRLRELGLGDMRLIG